MNQLIIRNKCVIWDRKQVTPHLRLSPSSLAFIQSEIQFLPAEELDSVHTYISKLDHAQFSQLADAAVGSLRLEKELSQGHLLAPEQFPHDENHTRTQLEGRNSAPTSGRCVRKVLDYNILKIYSFILFSSNSTHTIWFFLTDLLVKPSIQCQTAVPHLYTV